MRRTILHVLLFSALSAYPAYAENSCAALYSDELEAKYGMAKLVELMSKVDAKLGITSVFDTEGLRKIGFMGLFTPSARRIRLREGGDRLKRFATYLHEVVHANTDSTFRKSPHLPENAHAIRIARKNAPISEDLPKAYRNFFFVDEIKAHRRSSAILMLLGREQKATEPQAVRVTQNLGAEYRYNSEVFAATTEKVLAEARDYLISNPKEALDSILTKRYSPDAPNLYLAILAVPQGDSPIYVQFPIASETHPMLDVEALKPRLLSLCEEGIRIARRMRLDTNPKP